MQKISERIATILENGEYSILFNSQVEGFLNDRWEIMFSGGYNRFNIQIFEAGIKHPGNVQLNLVNSKFETLLIMLQIGLKPDYSILNKGSSNGKDLYIKIHNETEFFDIYIDPR